MPAWLLLMCPSPDERLPVAPVRGCVVQGLVATVAPWRVVSESVSVECQVKLARSMLGVPALNRLAQMFLGNYHLSRLE